MGCKRLLDEAHHGLKSGAVFLEFGVISSGNAVERFVGENRTVKGNGPLANVQEKCPQDILFSRSVQNLSCFEIVDKANAQCALMRFLRDLPGCISKILHVAVAKDSSEPDVAGEITLEQPHISSEFFTVFAGKAAKKFVEVGRHGQIPVRLKRRELVSAEKAWLPLRQIIQRSVGCQLRKLYGVRFVPTQ